MVAAGQMWVDPEIVKMLAEGMPQREDRSLQHLLTTRERQVLQALYEGLTNKEIAGQLGVSESAIKATLHSYFRKRVCEHAASW